jgi:DNA-binding IclR family transcriptional regulator
VAGDGKTRSSEVQSVHRALQLLETIGLHGPLTAIEIAGRLGLAVSTVHNMLRTLVRRGYLLNSGGKYHLGPAITALASQWDPAGALPELVQPTLEQVSQDSGHAALAVVVVGAKAQLIGYRSAPGPIVATAVRGMSVDPLALAVGRVVVAWSRERDWPMFVDTLTDLDDANADADAPRSRTDWFAHLRAIAATGVCLKRPRNADAVVALAVPVWASGGGVVCGLGCSMPGYLVSTEDLQHTLDVLWSATIELSRLLGCEDIPIGRPALPA